MEQAEEITLRDVKVRWQEIVTALADHGIGPDLVTAAALTIGGNALSESLGLIDKPSEPSAFSRSASDGALHLRVHAGSPGGYT